MGLVFSLVTVLGLIVFLWGNKRLIDTLKKLKGSVNQSPKNEKWNKPEKDLLQSIKKSTRIIVIGGVLIAFGGIFSLILN